MTGKPKFVFGGEEGTYEDFERKLYTEIAKAGLSTEFKKKSFLYKHLTGSVLDNLTKLIFPTKISEKSFNELLETLKNHYIPNKHLRERVLLYARIQGDDEATQDYFEDLKNIASRCKYKEDVLKVILCDKTFTGIRCPHLRESLFVAGISPSCTAAQYMEYALLFEENIRKERLAKEKKANNKNGKLNVNNNIERTPSPNPKKPKSDSPASKFGISLKKNNDNNNNNNKNGTMWEQKAPLTPQATFGVTLKSKSTTQVSPKTSPIPNSDAQKENVFPVLKTVLNGTANRSNSMSSPKSNVTVTIPEIKEPVKEPKKAALTPEARMILEKHGFVPKTAQKKEPAWSPSPSPEPRKPIAITLEAKKILDKHNQNKEPPKPPPRRDRSWSPSPSPEPRNSRIQDNRGRSTTKDAAPKLKRSSSNLSVRDKPSVNELSPTNTAAPAPKLKRSSSNINISRNPLPEPPQKNVSSGRILRESLPVLKSVKNLRPDPEPVTNRERFDISDKLPKLRSTGILKQSPSEVIDFLPEILEDTEPRKPTITDECRNILDKYCNKAPPKNDPPKPPPRRAPSYSPSPEPEPRSDLTRKQLFDKYAKPSTPTTPNKSSPYSDLTKSDLFDQFLQAKNSPTSTLKVQKQFKINKPKKEEAPQLTDEDRRKLEEKYGIIRAKPKENIPADESPKPERKKSPSRAKKSFDIFEEKTKAAAMGIVKPSDKVVKMYNESKQVNEALKEAFLPSHPERSNGITPTTPTEKPLITIKASPKIAEMYKAQVEKRDKTRCPSPPTERVTSNITRYAEKKWTSTLDLSTSKKEHDPSQMKRDAQNINARDIVYTAELDYGDSLLKVSERDAFNYRTIKTDLFPQAAKTPDSPGPSVNRKTDSPGPTVIPPKPALRKEPPKLAPRREPSWSPSPSPEPQDSRQKDTPPKKEQSWSPSPSHEPRDSRRQKAPLRREPSWSPSITPEPRDSKRQEAPLRRDPNWSPSITPEPRDSKRQEAPLRRDPYWSPSITPEPRDSKRQEASLRRELSWSPSPPPEPRNSKIQDTRGRSYTRDAVPKLKRSISNLNIRDNLTINAPRANKLKRATSTDRLTDEDKRKLEEKYGLIKTKPKETIPEESQESPKPERMKSPSRAKKSFEIFEEKTKEVTMGIVKASDKVVQMYKDSKQMKEILMRTSIPVINPPTRRQPIKPPPRFDPYWSPSVSPEPRDSRRQDAPQRREKSWSPSPSPEPHDSGMKDTRGRSSTRNAAPTLKRSISNLNVRNKPIINTVQAPKLKRSTSTDRLTDEDKHRLEEKYGIIKAKPKETIPEESQESPQPERNKSPSRAKKSFEIFEEKSKAMATDVENPSDKVDKMYKESKKVEEAVEGVSLPVLPERSNGITPTKPTEKPLIRIKAPPKMADMYKAQIEKRNKIRCPSPPLGKVTTNVTRSAEKKWTSTLDLATSKKEYSKDELRKEALKINVKDIKYNAELSYGDSLLKVSEKDAFTYRTIKTDLFPQAGNKPDSPGPSVNRKTDSPGPSVIPPKPGTAAAAKPQFDISSFFDGSAYDNFLQSAKTTKGGRK